MVNDELLRRVEREFRNAKVMTLEQGQALLSCSQRSVQRYFSHWGCLRSYNRNGRYFTTRNIPDFNAFGLWTFQGIGFSQFGNLRDTVVQLVCSSPAGLAVADLGRLLEVNAHSFMSQFKGDPRLTREKWEGYLIYFSAEPDRRIAQRRERASTHPIAPFPSDAQAVHILVVLIKNPDLPLKDLADIVIRDQPGIDFGMVERLLEHHGLIKKNS